MHISFSGTSAIEAIDGFCYLSVHYEFTLTPLSLSTIDLLLHSFQLCVSSRLVKWNLNNQSSFIFIVLVFNFKKSILVSERTLTHPLWKFDCNPVRHSITDHPLLQC